MKKFLAVVALGALIVTSSIAIANAQQRGSGYYGSPGGEWHCPWRSGQQVCSKGGGWGFARSGKRHGRGWHMGLQGTPNRVGTGGHYGPQYRAGR